MFHLHPHRTIAGLLVAACLGCASTVLANVPVVVVAGEQSEPVMAADGAGGAFVAWQDYRGGAESDIYAQRIGPDGAPLWAPGGVAVCTAPAFQTLPRIVADGAGGVLLAWTDYRNGNGDVYAQRLGASGNAIWTPGGLPICDDPQPQLGVSIAADGSGGVIAVWEDFRSGPDGDLYVQRVGAAGAPSWGLNGTVVCDAAGAQAAPSVCSGGAGSAVILWRDHRASGSGDLYAQRMSAAGNRQWTADGVLVCGAAGGQYDAGIVSDGAGGGIAVWSDERDANPSDIYAQRIGVAGAPLWTADGVRVCGAGSYQLFPVVAADGAGGVVIAWEDSRSDTTVDVYAQRVGPDGTPLWTPDGVRLADTPGYESLPSICADGGGGAIVAWQDQREFNDDIYAQRVSGAGVRLWSDDGIAVSTAMDAQLGPALVSDGAGGALFAWYDARSGDWDVYAQHADAWGGMGGVAGVPTPRPAARLSLAPPAPHPARGATVLRFTLPEAGAAELTVYDAAGRRVRTLIDAPLPAGSHAHALDAARTLGPGVYFVRLSAMGRSAATRLIVLP